MILETERLLLRWMTRDDRPALAAILQDAETMTAYEHAFSSEEVDSWLENQLRRYAEDGFGLWAVVQKESGRMIGQCGITWQQWGERRVPEIGYLFNKSYWHSGYATEAAVACRQHAFRVLGFSEVYSIIRESNVPSRRVAQRNGMRPVGHMVKHYHGVTMPHVVYSVEAGDEVDELTQTLLRQTRQYPGMEAQDYLCLLHERRGPCVPCPADEDALAWLRRRLARPGLFTAAPRQPEPIGRELCRVHLSSLSGGPQAETLEALSQLSMRSGAGQETEEEWQTLCRLAEAGRIPVTPQALAVAVSAAGAGAAPEHSERYTALYQPDYLILDEVAALFLPVFAAVDRLLAAGPRPLVAIDGMSGAGKSTLAAMLQEVYRCSVLHADDFFLRPEQRTPERYARPGGNIDMERLGPVVMARARGEETRYRPYNCETQQLQAPRTLPADGLCVVEGAYSLHPQLAGCYDLRVFVGHAAAVQRERILRRNGPEDAEVFCSRWIPLENRYLSHFRVREGCDVVVDSSAVCFPR